MSTTTDPQKIIEYATLEVVVSTPVSYLKATVFQAKLVETLLPSMPHVENLEKFLNHM